MRCRFCGSTSLHADSENKRFSVGKAIAGTVVFGSVGAVAGINGKSVKGYRCGACGAFMEAPMDAYTELSVNNAIRDAEAGRDRSMFDYYKRQYANIQAHVTGNTQSVTSSVSLSLPETDQEDAQGSSIKRSYRSNEWQPDSPVYVEDIVIRTDGSNDKLSLAVWNTGNKALRSVYFNVKVFDDTGDLVSETRCVYQGLNVPPEGKLPEEKEFDLKTDLAYRVELFCEKAAFDDDSIWRGEESLKAFEFDAQPVINENNFPRFKYIKTRYITANNGKLPVYLPMNQTDFWLCNCGRPVPKDQSCPRCGDDWNAMEAAFSQIDLIKKQHDAVISIAAERVKGINKLLEKQKDEIYSSALKTPTETVFEIKKAINLFDSISGYKDSDQRKNDCYEKLYNIAVNYQASESAGLLKQAVDIFTVILDWKDSAKRKQQCEQSIAEIEKEERERKRQEAAAEFENQKAAAKKKMIISSVAAFLIIASIAGFCLIKNYIIPSMQYNKAVTLLNNGEYDAAADAFRALNGFKDSAKMIRVSQNSKLYDEAVALMNSGSLTSAYAIFKELGIFKDSADKRNEILSMRYDEAVDLLNSRDFDSAYSIFKELGYFKDSADKRAEILSLLFPDAKNIGECEGTYNYQQDFSLVCSFSGSKLDCKESYYTPNSANSERTNHYTCTRIRSDEPSVRYYKAGKIDPLDEMFNFVFSDQKGTILCFKDNKAYLIQDQAGKYHLVRIYTKE